MITIPHNGSGSTLGRWKQWLIKKKKRILFSILPKICPFTLLYFFFMIFVSVCRCKWVWVRHPSVCRGTELCKYPWRIPLCGLQSLSGSLHPCFREVIDTHIPMHTLFGLLNEIEWFTTSFVKVWHKKDFSIFHTNLLSITSVAYIWVTWLGISTHFREHVVHEVPPVPG